MASAAQHHHGASSGHNAVIRSKAILLHAIFPSLHPSVAEETAATTTSIAHGVRRAHRIVFPSSTLGKDIEGASGDVVRRAHYDYIRHTVVQGTQVTDVSHRREYSETVGVWRVDTDNWDKAQAHHVAKKLLSRFQAPQTPTTAQHPSSPFFEQTSPPISEASHSVNSASASAAKPPLTNSGTEQHPAPVWLTTVPVPPSTNVVHSRVLEEASHIRATEPLERYADVFDPHDHKGSLAKELFLDGGNAGFQERWAAASPHLLAGLSALATSGPIMPSNASSAGIELRLPTFGHCFVRHDDIVINTLRLSAKHTKISLLAPSKPEKKSREAHEPAEDNYHHHAPEDRPMLNVKTKRIKVKMNPATLTITPAATNNRPDAPSRLKAKQDVIVVSVCVKNVSIKCHGDILMAPSGRHTLAVEKADVNIGSLSISTDRCGYNALLFVLSPVVKRILQGEIAAGLVGRRPL